MFVTRNIQKKLFEWKRLPERKALILHGARQVGKTALLKHFGKEGEFRKIHYFNFEKEINLHRFFESNLNPLSICENLEIAHGENINLHEDLVILDEIQACPQALTSLKYFSEECPYAYVAAAGSLLGITLGVASFPVGKVTHIELYPFSFDEFLDAAGDSKSAEHMREFTPSKNIPIAMHDEMWNAMLRFIVSGGLPELACFWKEKGSLRDKLDAISSRQDELLKEYLSDIAKHSGKENALHIESILRNIPAQLARAVNDSAPKFQFKDVLPGKKGYAELRGPVDWLECAGLVYRVHIAERAQFPLKAYCKDNRFKLFLFDTGILRALSGFPPHELLAWTANIYKGYFAENFVLHLLFCSGLKNVCSWNEGESEIEFLLESAKIPIPVEVKSGNNTRSRSLKIYRERYNPPWQVILSAKPFSIDRSAKKMNIPLYLAAKLSQIVESLSY